MSQQIRIRFVRREEIDLAKVAQAVLRLAQEKAKSKAPSGEAALPPEAGRE